MFYAQANFRIFFLSFKLLNFKFLSFKLLSFKFVVFKRRGTGVRRLKTTVDLSSSKIP